MVQRKNANSKGETERSWTRWKTVTAGEASALRQPLREFNLSLGQLGDHRHRMTAAASRTDYITGQWGLGPRGPGAGIARDQGAVAGSGHPDRRANHQSAREFPFVRGTPIWDGNGSPWGEPPLQRRTHSSEFTSGIFGAWPRTAKK
jgi:hypothetical protein